ncbi:hypothetical protein WA588_004741, partial [Blastocystis sp. NMH]
MLKSFISSLKVKGFDLVAPFCVQDYNQKVEVEHQLPVLNQKNTLALLIGNSRYLWPIFIKDLVDRNYEPNSSPNPLDEYTSLCIGDALKNIPVESKCFFYFTKNGQHFIPFQRLAEIANLGVNSPRSHLCYSPVYSSWFGLRAVIIFDMDFKGASLDPLSALTNTIDPEDDEKAKNLLAELMSSTNYRKEKSLDGVWRRWLSVRTLFREQKMPYTWNQAAYHYSKNQLYLKGDMDRMRNGTY